MLKCYKPFNMQHFLDSTGTFLLKKINKNIAIKVLSLKVSLYERGPNHSNLILNFRLPLYTRLTS